MLGDEGLQEYTYKKIEDKEGDHLQRHQRLARHHRQILGGDAVARPESAGRRAFLHRQDRHQGNLPDRLSARRQDRRAGRQRDGRSAPVRRRQGSSTSSTTTNKQLHLNRFDLLIDWGWFYFITKPLFIVIDWFYRLVGNFGVAILIVTVLIKLAFFPLANKSYASMAKMKAVQPQMAALRERYPDDKAKQQQELMALYKKEKINPLAGCLPIAIQIPVFFSLYKVLFVTIEMRHAPFFGWIHDLSAPDPTNVFTLFGLIPFDPTVVPVGRPLPASRPVAADHGRDHVGADEAQPVAARSDAGDDLQLDAGDLHLHAGELPGRAGDLLGLEQLAVGGAAVDHHAQARGQDRAVRQYQGAVWEEKDADVGRGADSYTCF